MAIGKPFTNLFGRSPIKPMQEHMAKVRDCADLLTPFFEAVLANDWEAAAQQQQAIRKIEHEADRLKKTIRLQLPNSLCRPMPSGDLPARLSLQDKSAYRPTETGRIGRCCT